MSKKNQKSYALEVSLIVLVIAAAFVVQQFLNSGKPPSMPERAQSGEVANMAESAPKNGEDEKQGGDGSSNKSGKDELAEVPQVYNPVLSDLGETPVWGKLDDYQYSIHKQDFVRELNDVFTLRGAWKEWVTINENHALIRTHAKDETKLYTLYFRKDASDASESKKNEEANDLRYWRKREEILHQQEDLPLLGVRIVLDPGHIGGNYAQMEGRRFVYKESAPVQEGNLTLIVAELLKEQLELLGAEVKLTRESNAPVNPHRIENYQLYALSKINEVENIVLPQNQLELAKTLSERLFYRAGEIKERARLINRELKPDLVVCLHFNASDWSDKILASSEHCHILLNGAYTAEELKKDNDRFTLVNKILQRIHGEELALSASVARAFTHHTGLPPYSYDPESPRAVNVDGDPYLWARNLAANRQFMCPVVYCEPYLMNGADSHQRILLGDYEGLRYVNGMLRPSIFREYVNAVTEGLVNYYSKRELNEAK